MGLVVKNTFKLESRALALCETESNYGQINALGFNVFYLQQFASMEQIKEIHHRNIVRI